MTAAEFLAEFDPHHFPATLGPWVSFDDHDPPFRMRELDQMQRMALIELDKPGRRYRLTLKASAIRVATS